MRKHFVFFLMMFPMLFWAQYLLPNEETIFSFQTKSGKTMSLVKDKKNEYIQYRFGSKDRVEMEFPATRTKESWKQFTYSSYHRGGGKQNAGMDLNYLTFIKNNYKYQLFRTYSAEDESFSTGVTVTDSKGKETDITGVYKTIKGCMCNLEDTDVKKEDFGS
ncbi:hypothetical protein [Chryseobacterium vrystaatense]|uniref:Uncharacterized protein n=1 Tax=Chryseobacterium vrystaatense TaxID=307480 RepID=A0A1M5LMD8_9FLAO|nr:hypothetical protein [Chryseobacterium vrystaatense]KFF25035.1 hypothetical protein IW16_16545 [Chryseobacterium vrystaatense]SHG66264.1 hypothetical protein SAMN02787073_4601 [Chryseobacterium vrystaatense]